MTISMSSKAAATSLRASFSSATASRKIRSTRTWTIGSVRSSKAVLKFRIERSHKKAPVTPGLFRQTPARPLKYRDVFEQRYHAQNDHDDADDLLGAAIERQQVDEIQNQNDDQKGHERTDEHVVPPIYARKAAFAQRWATGLVPS